jgi:deaminated glutathione amidase
MTDRAGQPWRIGLGVCYDLRFPELFRALTQTSPCDVLVLPAAFTHTTGQAHWEVLLRARAIENLCHVMAPAQGGVHASGRRTFGHSLVIDPWGKVLAFQAEGPGVVLADLSQSHQTKLRQQLPALDHRRL